MRLVAIWIHLVGMAVWVGGLVYQSHVLLPAARRGGAGGFTDAARRARPITWTAVALVLLTGFYNVTQLGPLERVMESGAGMLLAGKFILVIAVVALAGQRDFAQVPRLRRAIEGGDGPDSALVAIGILDHIVLALLVVIMYLGLMISRASPAGLVS